MRQELMLLILIGLVMALAVLSYRAVFGEAPAHDLMVVSARSASRTVGGQGAAESLSPGDVVGVADVVMTDTEGTAALQYGNGAQLMLEESTTMRVLDADDHPDVVWALGGGELGRGARQRATQRAVGQGLIQAHQQGVIGPVGEVAWAEHGGQPLALQAVLADPVQQLVRQDLALADIGGGAVGGHPGGGPGDGRGAGRRATTRAVAPVARAVRPCISCLLQNLHCVHTHTPCTRDL